MPCSDHAVLLKATAQQGRRETACGLPVRVRLLPATTRSSTKIVIRSTQSSSQRSIPTPKASFTRSGFRPAGNWLAEREHNLEF